MTRAKTPARPKTRKLELVVDPSRGAAYIAESIVPPDGYVFSKMVRNGAKATITYRRIDP